MSVNTLTWQRCLATLAPSGTIEITENGEYDVAQYATADVNVSGGGSTEYNIECYDDTLTKQNSYVYAATIQFTEDEEYSVIVDTSAPIDKAAPGSMIAVNGILLSDEEEDVYFLVEKQDNVNDLRYWAYPKRYWGEYAVTVMPAQTLYVYIATWM